MATLLKPDRKLIAHDFRTAMHGKMDPAALDAACAAMASDGETAYPANGSVASMIFYLVFQVQITSPGGKQFNGQGGGLSSPGGGALFGDVYTSDLNKLYAQTKSFEFNCAFVYTSLVFFDGGTGYLGSFQSGSVSTVAGIGGGSGGWS